MMARPSVWSFSCPCARGFALVESRMLGQGPDAISNGWKYCPSPRPSALCFDGPGVPMRSVCMLFRHEEIGLPVWFLPDSCVLSHGLSHVRENCRDLLPDGVSDRCPLTTSPTLEFVHAVAEWRDAPLGSLKPALTFACSCRWYACQICPLRVSASVCAVKKSEE